MSSNVFINYRRQTEAGMAGRIYDSLSRELPGISFFMDVDKLHPGEDFEQGLDRSLANSKVLLALIGPEWATMTNSNGQRRLDAADDFVRREIKTALAKGVRVIPVLVSGAKMPAASLLPDDLKPLAKRHAVELRHERFNADIQELVNAVATAAPGARATSRRVAKAAIGLAALAGIGAGAYYIASSQWLSWSDQDGYQRQFDRQLALRRYPAQVEARVSGKTVQYRGTFVPFPDSKTFGFHSRHSIPDEEFAAFDATLSAKGYKRVFHQEIMLENRRYHQGTWIKP